MEHGHYVPHYASATPAARPPVVLWQRVYCGCVAFLLFGMTALYAVFFFFPHLAADGQRSVAEMRLMGAVMGALCGAFMLAFVAAFFLPRRPWAWVYNTVLIALGLTGLCTLPACILLLIFWLKPETKAYFDAA